MNIVGFNFTKIAAERKRSIVGTINISNNVSLSDVRETKLGIGGGQGAVKISFAFKSNYTPDMAKMEMEGDVLLLADEKKVKQVMDGWKSGNKVPSDVAQAAMNHILNQCNIQALLLSKDLNLPSPVPLPKVRTGPAAKPAPVKKKAKKKK